MTASGVPKGGAKISTEQDSFSLICNVLRIKKTWMVSYFCPMHKQYTQILLQESIKTCSYSKKYYFIFNPGISGVVSTNSKSFTISNVPCLYFWK